MMGYDQIESVTFQGGNQTVVDCFIVGEEIQAKSVDIKSCMVLTRHNDNGDLIAYDKKDLDGLLVGHLLMYDDDTTTRFFILYARQPASKLCDTSTGQGLNHAIFADAAMGIHGSVTMTIPYPPRLCALLGVDKRDHKAHQAWLYNSTYGWNIREIAPKGQLTEPRLREFSHRLTALPDLNATLYDE